MKRSERLWIFLLLFLAISPIGCRGHLRVAASSDNLLVHFIDVGYGDSILIEFPDGGNLLIDGGDKIAGEKVVEYLKTRGVKKLDMVVVTHPHPDHLEGLFLVVERYEIDSIVANEDVSESESYASFFEIVKGKEIPFKRVVRGEVIVEGEGIKMEVLHPDKLTGNLNNDSLVLKLTYKKVSFIFTADIGQKICDRLAEYYKEELKSNVLTVPHHSKSGSEVFFRMVSPELAVISTGESKWRNPGQEKKKLDILKSLGVEVLSTEKERTILLRTAGEKIWK